MPAISKVPSVVSLSRALSGGLAALAFAAAVAAWGDPGVALAQAHTGPNGSGSRLLGVGSHRDHAARAPSINASDIRIVLARTYLQTGGPKNIPLRDGERNALPLLQDPTAAQSATHVSIPLPPPCGRAGAPACTLPGVFISPPAEDQSSVFSNPDNTYLPAIIRPNQRDEVWVVRGKLPRTPRGESPVAWPNPRYQLRYWSLCTAIYARPYPTITNGGCLVDNDVVTDNKGFYTIVVSTARARPSTATTQNGVNWLRVRPGVANLLIVRNMLGAGFPYSTQNVTKDGSWQTAYLSMRQYYPSITVQCTTAHYLASGWQGCVAPKGSGVIGASQ